MTTEQKAMAYDEAIKRAKEINNEHKAQPFDVMLKVFPELKESEDEESKKWILEYLYDGLRKSDEQFKGQFRTAIAWLEKQWKPTKEQMKALHDLNLTGNISYIGQGQCLLELYNKLKEL